MSIQKSMQSQQQFVMKSIQKSIQSQQQFVMEVRTKVNTK